MILNIGQIYTKILLKKGVLDSADKFDNQNFQLIKGILKKNIF